MNAHPIRAVREPIDITLTCNSKVRKWAFENALTLIFLSILCVFNMFVTVVVAVIWG